MRQFAADQLADVLAAIKQPVFLPCAHDGVVDYVPYEAGVVPALDSCVTDKSPKDLLFPQWETLYRARLSGKNIQLSEQPRSEEDFVLFGVRACDLRAFEVLDKVFLADPVDTYYAARRAHATLIALACGQPDDACFCGVFGIDAADPVADIVLWKVDDAYYADAKTDKGKALLEQLPTKPAESAPVETAKADIRKALDAKPFAHLSLKGIDGEHLNELFNSPKWNSLSMACLGCGTCTFSCPTCQCYDIRDYDTGHGVERYRCWDSCMYSDFTLMAAGTPRPTQMQRYRQRFMHKLCYFPANNDGMYSCVGCGRCVRKCPMNLNIVKVIKALGEDEK